MEVYKLETAVHVFYVTATSFPEGVKQAWDQLHTMLPSTKDRNFYGISHGNKDGSITYMAAVEEAFDGESKKYDCKPFTIPAGEYIGKKIIDFMSKLPQIGETFQQLLNHPEFDDSVPCIEQYTSEQDVICMVKRKA